MILLSTLSGRPLGMTPGRYSKKIEFLFLFLGSVTAALSVCRVLI